MNNDLVVFCDTYKEKIETAIEEYVMENVDSSLQEAVLYAILNGGKKIRPLLTVAFLHDLKVELTEAMIKKSMAIEFIHAYSLVHDDLPAMDNDDFRRGMLTVHKKYGEDIAILVGDSLLSLAFQILAEEKDLDLIELLTKASGPKGMILGQIEDINGQDKQYDLDFLLNHVFANKTGALLGYSIQAAGVMAQLADEYIQELKAIGYAFGIAFQIKDDIDDNEQKSDANLGTVPHLIGLDEAKNLLASYLNDIETKMSMLEENLGIQFNIARKIIRLL